MQPPEGYRIEDEPRPSALSQIAVSPLWPLLAWMFGGSWIGWSWFVLNAIALGSPTRRREILTVVAGTLAAPLLLLGCLEAVEALGIGARLGVRSSLLALTLAKLTLSYFLYTWQARTFELYRYFGGVVRAGWPVLLAAYFGRKVVLGGVLEQLTGVAQILAYGVLA